MRKFGPRRQFIREWRKFHNLNQERLADRVGITQAYLSKLETGKAEYTQSLLEALAEALRCEPADLIMRPPEADQDIRLVWSQLSPDKRKQALGIIMLLKEGAAA
jgi:transcriptional regulator with XRE-family HTH domain